LAALAIVLVVGGAALSGFLVLNSGHKHSVIVVTHELRPGDPFTQADLEEGQLAISPAVSYVSWTEANRLVSGGYHAKFAIGKNSILTSEMVRGPATPGADCASAPVNVADGFYPAEGLHRGDVVRLLYAPGAGSRPAVEVPQVAPESVTPGATLMDNAYVSAVRAGSDQNSLTISVVLPASPPDTLRRVALTAGARAVYAVLLRTR